jgi:hypothetical protein
MFANDVITGIIDGLDQVVQVQGELEADVI